MFFECLQEVVPRAVVDGGLFLCCVLAVACPFSCWGAYFEMHKGGGYASGVVGVETFIQVVIVPEGTEEPFCFTSGSIKGF